MYQIQMENFHHRININNLQFSLLDQGSHDCVLYSLVCHQYFVKQVLNHFSELSENHLLYAGHLTLSLHVFLFLLFTTLSKPAGKDIQNTTCYAHLKA